MQDLQEIEIAKIKDLNLIYCTTVNPYLDEEHDKQQISLQIVYGENQSIRYDSSSPYFLSYIKKVIQVYQQEKNQRKIEFLDEESKGLLEKLAVLSKKEESPKKHSQRPLAFTENRNFQIRLMQEYIMDALRSILLFFYPENELKIGKMMGYRNKYLLSYSVGEEEKYQSLILTKQDEKTMSFSSNGTAGIGFFLQGKIQIFEEYVRILWQNSDKTMSGSTMYDFNTQLLERAIRYEGKTIYLDQKNQKISSEEKEKIDFYLDLVGYKTIAEGIKTAKNNFLLFQTELDEKNIGNRLSYHINFQEQCIQILKTEKYGLSHHGIFIPFEQHEEEILFLPIESETSNLLLVQKRCGINRKIADDSSCSLDNYSYEMIETEENVTLGEIFTTKKKTELKENEVAKINQKIRR